MKILKTIKRSFLLVGLGLTLLTSPVVAQVFDSGPSDPSLFDTVVTPEPPQSIISSDEERACFGGDGSTVQLNISDGVFVGRSFKALAGAEVNIGGGEIECRFDADLGSEVNISGGNIGRLFGANLGSKVNISGGEISDFFDANIGSEVNISGGNFGRFFEAGFGSEVNISGGVFDERFCAGVDSVVNISGGTFGRLFDADLSSVVNISGGTFGDFCDFGVPPLFLTVDELIQELLAGRTQITITGGDFGEGCDAFVGSELNISGGSFGPRFEVGVASREPVYINCLCQIMGSVVNISGGSFDEDFRVNIGSEVNISGGSFGAGFRAGLVLDNFGFFIPLTGGGVANISGGSFGENFGANSDSEVNLFGREFQIDGVELADFLTGPDLEAFLAGQAVTITDRNVTLSGVFASGELFSFDLNLDVSDTSDFFCPEGTLTVTFVEPVILGDVNQDGVTTFEDIAPFIAVLANEEFQAEADCDQSGEVNFMDIQPFIDVLSGQ